MSGPSAQVLRNLGVPVKVHRIAGEAGTPARPYRREFGPDGEPVLEDRWVQFTNASLAEIEEPEPLGFGSVDAWQRALGRTPSKAVSKTLALAWGLYEAGLDGALQPDWHLAGVMLRDGELEKYAAAIGAAYMLAQGVTPERVGEWLAQSEKDLRIRQSVLDATVERMLDADSPSAEPTPISQTEAAPGPGSSEPGSGTGTTLSSSGASAPRKRRSA